MNKLILDSEKFSNLVGNICRDIAVSNWRPDYIVGITRGGLLPAVMASHYFNAPMYTLGVSLRDNKGNIGPEHNCWMSEDAFGYDGDTYDGDAPKSTRGKNILIIDDINDTGATFNWIMQDWQSGCLPKDPRWNNIWGNNVRFAVVIDNLSSQCSRKMDYAGMEINKAEDDVWVDFPYEDWWAK